MSRLIPLFTILVLLASCNGTTRKPASSDGVKQQTRQVEIPAFVADSAYRFVAAQLEFGPRVPGSDAHTKAAVWLLEKLQQYADTAMIQHFKARVYNNTIFDGKNIIGSFNPQARKRILLGAHWDSRPYADHDPDPANRRKPIDGANDGASGVGVLIEIARLLSQNPINPELGVDIIFFDLEDYGPHQDDPRSGTSDEHWALGSQHWSRNPHVPGYRAQFGILLDMVGAPGAVFPREYFSQQYASWVLDKVWRTAQRMGYDYKFVNKPGAAISDDHLPVNQIAGIPMINIIHLDPNSRNGTFYDYWHTTGDNLSQIDKETLRIVGEVLTRVIYESK
ncbi:MAG TPA: M28 family peptidase [Bacteroidales bacterium]|nr:M28 family peptidase [Bacteroidales bacterium]